MVYDFNGKGRNTVLFSSCIVHTLMLTTYVSIWHIEAKHMSCFYTFLWMFWNSFHLRKIKESIKNRYLLARESY